MKQPSVSGIVGRLLVALPFCLLLAYGMGPFFVEGLLPLFRGLLNLAAPGPFRVQGLGLAELQGDIIVRAILMAPQAAQFAGHALPAGAAFTCSTLLGHALVHPVILYTLILVWPTTTSSRRVYAAMLALPALIVVEALDVPLVLAASGWDLLLYQRAPELLSRKPLVLWMHFLNGGGRYALSIVAALIAMGCVSGRHHTSVKSA